MLEALDRHAPEGASWTRPFGGFFILMELAGSIDTAKALPVAIESGVAYVPGQPFFVDEGGQKHPETRLFERDPGENQ